VNIEYSKSTESTISLFVIAHALKVVAEPVAKRVSYEMFKNNILEAKSHEYITIRISSLKVP